MTGTDGSPVLRAVKRFLEHFSDHRRIGVAVSGGSDSTGLLSALVRAAGPNRIVALTVDHGLRRESADEAQGVAELSERLGACHETLHWLGSKPKSGVQAAARAARYDLLSEAAFRLDLAAIATAHTAGDQAETLAMRDARGVESEGNTGIPPATLRDESVWFLRPLLHLSRDAIRSHLQASRLGWVDDPSNTDEKFERVRVRQAGVAAQDLTLPWRIRTERAEQIGEVIAARASRNDDDVFGFDVAGLERDIALRCMRALVDMAGGRDRGLDRHGLERLADFVGQRDMSRLTVGRVLLHKQGDHITMRRERRNVAQTRIGPGDEILWDGRYRIANRDPSEWLAVTGSGHYGILPELTAKAAKDEGTEARPGGFRGGCDITRICGRASRLMPVFEKSRADAMAALSGRAGFVDCPWSDWMSVSAPE